jgi:predicted neutral ceramidase superfamily lipid hydrolase
MDKLTAEQEDLVNDCHEKRLKEEEKKEHKVIPINRKRFDQILKIIGRKKL